LAPKQNNTKEDNDSTYSGSNSGFESIKSNEDKFVQFKTTTEKEKETTKKKEENSDDLDIPEIIDAPPSDSEDE